MQNRTTNGANGKYDVAVAGGGPAGAALATFLQRRGHRCIVLEARQFPRYHIGESLIPNTYGVLDRLGLLPKLRRSDYPVKYSVRFVSPSGEESQPFYFFETIEGERSQTWQVERGSFDEMCLESARESGVEVRQNHPVEKVVFDNGRAVGVVARDADGQAVEIGARVVVDASGRTSLIGRQLGLTSRVPGLDKAAIWSYFRGGKRLEGIDEGETTVFMLPRRGWFWYIPLPDDVVSVGIVADPDYLFDESPDFNAVFPREVARCSPLSARLAPAQQIAPIRGLRRLAYRNVRVAGDGWLMVGDAAAFLDPIYSSGLFLALAGAELAAECVHDALAADECSEARLGAYSGRLFAGVEVIRRLIHAFYNPQFSFREFVDRFPEQKPALIDCLVGDVIDRDMSGLLDCLAKVTPPPPPL